jgi:hypothetical protein
LASGQQQTPTGGEENRLDKRPAICTMGDKFAPPFGYDKKIIENKNKNVKD